MNPKITDPAAGRLGRLSEAAGTPLPEGGPRKSNYGTRRLGLVLETDDEPARSPRGAHSQALREPPPGPPTGSSISPQPQPDGAEQPPPDEADRQSPQPRSRSNRRRTSLLIGAGLATVAAALAVVALWAGGTDETTPQMASASPGTSAPARQPAAVHESKAQQHAPREALPQPQGHSPERTASAEAGPPPRERPAPARPKPRPAGARRRGSLSRMILARALRMLAPRPRPVRSVPTARLVPPAPRPVTPPAPPKPAAKRPPAPARKVSPPELRLSGIMRGPDGHMAIINDRFVSEGSLIEGARVVRIDDFTVQIDYRRERFVLGVSSPKPRRAGPAEEEDSVGTSGEGDQSDQ